MSLKSSEDDVLNRGLLGTPNNVAVIRGIMCIYKLEDFQMVSNMSQVWRDKLGL